MKRLRSRGVWALGDQAIVSLGNFATNIILARALLPADYGMYAVLLGVLLLINSLHAALIASPLLVLAPKESPQNARHLGLASIWLGIMSLPLGLVILMAITRVLQLEGFSLALALLALGLWQAQEITRRYLMAKLHHARAIGGDALSYLGQAAGVALLAHLGVLSINAVLLVMAITSGSAFMLQFIQGGLSWVRPTAIFGQISQFWEIGRWLILSAVVSSLSLQAFPWTLTYLHGPESAAAFQALINLLGITNPIILGISFAMNPEIAKLGNLKSSLRIAMSYFTQGSLLLMPYYAFLIMLPSTALRFLYGLDSDYLPLTTELAILTLGYIFLFPSRLNTSLLYASGHARTSFFVQGSGALVVLLIGVPLTIANALQGAVLGSVFSSLTQFLCGLLLLYMQLRKRPSPRKEYVS